MSYRWPSKLKKFGVVDPFLKVIVSKHEKEIPWQIEVKDEKDLIEFVSQKMLPH